MSRSGKSVLFLYITTYVSSRRHKVMPEGEKHWGVPVVIGGDNLPSPVEIGLTDLPNIKGATGYQALYKLSIF